MDAARTPDVIDENSFDEIDDGGCGSDHDYRSRARISQIIDLAAED